MNITISLVPVVSIVAGILILIIPRLLSTIVAVYLIVIGLSTIFALAISGVITGVLALVAGIFILIGR